MVECFTELDSNSDCRAVVLSGAGKNLTAGNIMYCMYFSEVSLCVYIRGCVGGAKLLK